MFSKSEIRDLRGRFPELAGLDDSSIDRALIDNILFTRSQATKKAEANRAAKIAAAKAAYDAELIRYRTKNPTGKNARKSAQRKAREIWPSF